MALWTLLQPAPSLFAVDIAPLFSVTHFTAATENPYTNEQILTDYNRLRGDTTFYAGNLKGAFVVDHENRLADPPETLVAPDDHFFFENRATLIDRDGWLSEIKLHRAYLDISFAHSNFIAGLQRIPFGVGRIWTPIDAFDPLQTLSLEPGERKGTPAVHWIFHLNDFSRIGLVYSVSEDKSPGKSGVYLRSFLDPVDLGLVLFYEEYETPLQQEPGSALFGGYQAEANLFSTGAEVRTEGVWEYKNEFDLVFGQSIWGIDRSFPHNIWSAFEYYHIGQGRVAQNTLTWERFAAQKIMEDDRHYLGLTLALQPGVLWSISSLFIYRADDESGVAGLSAGYSAGENASLGVGMFLFTGDDLSEFGGIENLYYATIEIFL